MKYLTGSRNRAGSFLQSGSMRRKRKKAEADERATDEKIWYVCLTCHRALANLEELGTHRYEQHASKLIAGLVLNQAALNPVVRVERYRHGQMPALELGESIRIRTPLKRRNRKNDKGKKTILSPDPIRNAGETLSTTTPEMEIKIEDFTMPVTVTRRSSRASHKHELGSKNDEQAVNNFERLGLQLQSKTLPFASASTISAEEGIEYGVAEEDANEDFDHFDEVQDSPSEISRNIDERRKLEANLATETGLRGSSPSRTMTRPTRTRKKIYANLEPDFEDEFDSESSVASSYVPSEPDGTDTDGENLPEQFGNEIRDASESNASVSRRSKGKDLKANSWKPSSYAPTRPNFNKRKMSEFLWAWCSNRACRVAFNTKERLTKHCIRAPSHRVFIRFSCEACRVEFDHSAHEGEDEQSISECQKCSINYLTLLNQHVGARCELSRMTQKDFQKNRALSRIRQLYECSICFLNFTHLGKLIQHQKSDHSEEEVLKHSSTIDNFAAPQDEVELKAAANIEGNVIERQEEATSSSAVSTNDFIVDSTSSTPIMEKKTRFAGVIHNVKRGAQLSCRYCQATFPILHRLNDHIKCHHLKKYQCDTCPKLFISAITLERHRTYDHTGRKDFLCTVCAKAFVRPEFLERHMKVVHEDRDKYHCDSCVKKFACPAALNRHKKHHTVKERNYLCPDCGKTYKFKNDLGKHIRKEHAQLGETVLKCSKPTCNFKCFGEKTLQSHIQSQHSPHECSHCGKMYSSKQKLREHVRRLSPTVGKYPCEVCKVRFTKKKYLREHGPECPGPGPQPEPEEESPSSRPANKNTLNVECGTTQRMTLI